LETNLLKFIWKHSRRQQLTVVVITLLSFPILYLTLELPKWIINDALSKTSIDKSLFGWELGPVAFLTTLCFMLLALIILSGVLKMRINTHKGIIGERLIRRLRYILIQNTLRFPLPYFSHISSGELISTVTAETEPLGGYIGESIALPLFQGGTMITILIFMFAQDWVFGLASIALIPVQGYLIPKLQHQVNLLKKERVNRVRKLSERIGETVAGATEIRLHGTQPYTLSEFSRRLGELFQIRLEIFKKKFFMKFLNNTIGQVTPFLFYLFGGYLVIKGDLTIGALVAAIGAYKDLTSPWRELLNFYQLHEDSKIKYQQIIELFNPAKLVEVDEVETEEIAEHIAGDIKLENVSWRNEHNEQILSGISLHIPAGSTVAITGDYPVRRARLAQILVGLEQPSSGKILIDGKPMQQIPDSILRRRLALQGPDPHIFVGTVIENLEYGLMQYEPDYDCDDEKIKTEIDEAHAAGNRPPLDQGWLDYRQADQTQRQRSANWYLRVVKAMGANDVVSERSLLEVFDPVEKPELAELAERLLVARSEIKKRLLAMGQEAHVVPFNPNLFNPNASIAENILFGVATDRRLDCSELEIAPYLIDILEGQNLVDQAQTTGLKIATKLLKMLENNTISYQLRQHFGLNDETRVEQMRLAVDNYKSANKMSESSSCLFTALFLLLIPEHHRFVHFDNRSTNRIIQARREFKKNIPDDLRSSVLYFDAKKYHPKLSVKDNLLFGRMSSSHPAEERVINQLVEQVINELDLRKELVLLFGESQVGISGSRLPLAAKHRISFGRVLMKKPDILVFHDALTPFDQFERIKRREEARRLLPDATFVWISKEIPDPEGFDQVLSFTEAGPLTASGHHDVSEPPAVLSEPRTKRNTNAMELISNSAMFSELAPSQQRYIADNSRLVSLPRDTCLYETNDPADSVWLVVSGEVITSRTEKDGIQMTGTFHRPEVFGLLDILADSPRIMSAHTTVDTLALKIDANAIESVALSDARVSRALLRSLSNQWRS